VKCNLFELVDSNIDTVLSELTEEWVYPWKTLSVAVHLCHCISDLLNQIIVLLFVMHDFNVAPWKGLMYGICMSALFSFSNKTKCHIQVLKSTLFWWTKLYYFHEGIMFKYTVTASLISNHKKNHELCYWRGWFSLPSYKKNKLRGP
jgi:hypothetical protein